MCIEVPAVSGCAVRSRAMNNIWQLAVEGSINLKLCLVNSSSSALGSTVMSPLAKQKRAIGYNWVVRRRWTCYSDTDVSKCPLCIKARTARKTEKKLWELLWLPVGVCGLLINC